MNSKKHLCIVDDDKIYQFTIKKTLELKQAFRRLSFFDDGLEAIEYIKKHLNDAHELPDIILLDLKMPRMDGWSFLEEFSGLQAACAKPIELFLVTSSIDYRDKERALSYTQVNDFRVKPVTYEEMEGILMDLA